MDKREISNKSPMLDSEEGSSVDLPKKGSEEEEQRETWDRKLDFMLSCIGYAVGLGNIWRFPYLCYKNGGGAFLVPYFIFLLICGIPLFFLELSFGQFGALGPVAIWKIAPIFKGVGYAMMMISFIVCVYYNVIIAYSLHFIFNSFRAVLPWGSCRNSWNTDMCRDKESNETIALPPAWTNISCGKGQGWFDDDGKTFVNASFVSDFLNNGSFMGNDSQWVDYENLTNATSINGTYINGSCITYTTAAQEYFSRKVLRLTENIDVVGGIQWELFGCLVFAWCIVFVCLFKGVKWSGKVVYFTATFPYLVLIILLIRGVMEEGAMLGIHYYVVPQWEKLNNVKVWAEAAVQIFYSLGAAWGVLLSYSSLNNFKNNVYRDALTICSVNCCTSILSGFVVFAVLGSLAFQTGKDIEDVVDEGAGLAFVAYPAAVANLPVSPLWAFLFFFMLLNLGLDSQFGMIEAVVKGLLDEFKIFRDNRVKFLAGMCFLQFMLAIPMVTESGMYWVTLIDWYCAGLSLMLVALLEITCISWIYGVDRFIYDISCMIGHKPFGWQFWKLMWSVITPLCILCLMIANLVFYSAASYNGTKFPSWAEGVGWLSSLCSIMMIPGLAIYQLLTHPRAKGNLWQRVKALCRHDPDWGPRDEKFKYKYRTNSIDSLSGSMSKDHGKELDLLEPLQCCQRSNTCESTSSTSSTKSDPPAYSEAAVLP